MTTAVPLNGLNTIGRCQLCGNMRQTARVKFERNIGMIVLRQTRRLEASLCKSCVESQFWRFQGLNLVLGPWGMISLLLTPIYLVTNTVSYASARRELSGAVE
ncbi:MAG TPA: hypothetical protein VKD70_12850 [Candidatus Acidoferrum sp.]|nr:hypothetical protein [Candidatus Acidoferrum sp.]